jgi:hypothetical protein
MQAVVSFGSMKFKQILLQVGMCNFLNQAKVLLHVLLLITVEKSE